MIISTINALITSLRDDRPINKVYISHSKKGKKILHLKQLCRDKGVVLQFVPQEAIDRRLGVRNQGVYAEISPVLFLP